MGEVGSDPGVPLLALTLCEVDFEQRVIGLDVDFNRFIQFWVKNIPEVGQGEAGKRGKLCNLAAEVMVAWTRVGWQG